MFDKIIIDAIIPVIVVGISFKALWELFKELMPNQNTHIH